MLDGMETGNERKPTWKPKPNPDKARPTPNQRTNPMEAELFFTLAGLALALALAGITLVVYGIALRG
jgi:hypothetical protein